MMLTLTSATGYAQPYTAQRLPNGLILVSGRRTGTNDLYRADGRTLHGNLGDLIPADVLALVEGR